MGSAGPVASFKGKKFKQQVGDPPCIVDQPGAVTLNLENRTSGKASHSYAGGRAMILPGALAGAW
jgi:hypothetical protein